jgi:predicted nuclease of predicted toxin-antitoxin system
MTATIIATETIVTMATSFVIIIVTMATSFVIIITTMATRPAIIIITVTATGTATQETVMMAMLYVSH